jgi:hypothetical protein
MGPAGRRAALATHVVSSVGWLGAVIVFGALGVVAMASADERVVRGAYLVAEPLVWWVLVPFAVASLLSGLVSALGTAWGLLRHYWVLFKLVVTVVATGVLLLYTATVGQFASLAADEQAGVSMLRSPSLVIHAGLALVALLATVVLGVYKPRGLTPYGLRRRASAAGPRSGAPV